MKLNTISNLLALVRKAQTTVVGLGWVGLGWGLAGRIDMRRRG